MDAFRSFITNPTVLTVWLVVDAVSVALLIRDLATRNREIMPVMRLVWALTVLYSGVFGLLIYFYSGRKQISTDNLWRRSFRSVAHCYSGCGAGEITGVVLAVSLFAWGNWGIALLTFSLAYVAGFVLTIVPLVMDGEKVSTAFKDAVVAETASITVMELVAIGVDLWLSGTAGVSHPLFWSSLIISLTLGLLAAYPVNALLIHWGIKEGMGDPRKMAEQMHEHAHGSA